MKISKLKINPENPRTINFDKFEKLKKSISEFPEMMELRPIVIDATGTVIGGNMRLRALRELGYQEIPDNWVKRAKLTEEQKAQFIIKDNVSFGNWDWDALADQYDFLILDDWGLTPIDMQPELIQNEETSNLGEPQNEEKTIKLKFSAKEYSQIYDIVKQYGVHLESFLHGALIAEFNK